MGYITNQWLKGSPQRSKGHYPVKVDIESSMTASRWDGDHGIVCKIYARKQSGDCDYQCISMTQKELDSEVRELISGASGKARVNIAKSILTNLDDSDLLALLSNVLGKR